MTEVRALCLTDVVDSTKLAAALGEVANGALWDAHDRAARELLASYGGVELERTDGLMAMFVSADDAVGFALAYHHALAALQPPLVARAGVHVGALTIRPNPPQHVARGAKPVEVDGLGMAITARMQSLAKGGQTLLSADAREAVGAKWRVCSHGHWRMKGLPDPIEAFEVGDDDAPFSPPADSEKVYRVVLRDGVWVPVRDVPHGLPAERDAFVGRSSDLAQLARLVDSARLVSILGLGGTGKTRLAVHFGWTWLGDWPGGVWFCDLSEARSLEGIAHAVAVTLHVALGAGDPLVRLGHAIAGRGRCLVILDNFEQVARHAPETLGPWLDRAAEAHFVVTTREVLGVPGEHALALAPMSVDEAVELFVARATAAKRDFSVTEAEKPAIVELVRLLDALPLAVELAAARVRMMPPRTLLARVGERFKLLTSTGARRDRQATLRGTLDWSWDLLPPAERSALAQLSVFEGGFSLEAVEAVLDLGAHADAPWPLDALRALVDKSLVRQVSDERFDLLVSVQVYADEKRRGSGDDMALARHSAYFATFGTEAAIDALYSHGAIARLQRLAREIDNVVIACRRATAAGRWDEACVTLHATQQGSSVGVPPAAVHALARGLIEAPRVPDQARALALRVDAFAAFGLGLADPTPLLEEAARLYESLGDGEGVASCQEYLGIQAYDTGRLEEARTWFERALAWFREHGPQRRLVHLLDDLGNVDRYAGRRAQARARAEEALALARERGDIRGEAHVLSNLSSDLLSSGDRERGFACSEQALALCRAVGSLRQEAELANNVGYFHYLDGRYAEALAIHDRGLVASRRSGNRVSEASHMGNRSLVLAALGRRAEAVIEIGATLRIFRELAIEHQVGVYLGCLGQMLGDDGDFNGAEAAFAEGAGHLRHVGDPMELGLLLVRQAVVARRRGATAAASAHLDEAARCAERVGAGPGSELGDALAAARV